MLRELKRLDLRVGEVEAAQLAGRETAALVRDLTSDLRDLSKEVRQMLARDAAQERFVGQLHAQVQALAAQAGRDAGGAAGGLYGSVEGRDAARDEGKRTHHRALFWATVVAAAVSAIGQVAKEAFTPVRVPPAPTHQAP